MRLLHLDPPELQVYSIWTSLQKHKTALRLQNGQVAWQICSILTFFERKNICIRTSLWQKNSLKLVKADLQNGQFVQGPAPSMLFPWLELFLLKGDFTRTV